MVAIDVDGDGWQDLFVSRDSSPNLLLMNNHDGTFDDKALDADVAFNMDGERSLEWEWMRATSPETDSRAL